jgi:hypothetical protein
VPSTPIDPKKLFPKVAPRAELDEPALRTLMQNERAAGKVDPPQPVPQAFVRRMRESSSIGTGLAKFRRPDWIAKLAKAKAQPAPVVDELHARVSKQPDEASLREAHVILNDIGRLPDGGRLVREKVTQQVVDRLIEGGGGK